MHDERRAWEGCQHAHHTVVSLDSRDGGVSDRCHILGEQTVSELAGTAVNGCCTNDVLAEIKVEICLTGIAHVPRRGWEAWYDGYGVKG